MTDKDLIQDKQKLENELHYLNDEIQKLQNVRRNIDRELEELVNDKENKVLEKQKLKYENSKLKKEAGIIHRILLGISYTGPTLAFLIGILSIINIYQQNQVQNFCSALSDV
jgi:antitoxin component YwqK of YwqJK toxin-antitoxin module